MDFTFFIIIIGVLVAGLLGILWFLKNKLEPSNKNEDALLQNVNQMSGQLNGLGQLVDSLSQQVNERLKENRESLERTSKDVNSKISDFTTGVTKVSKDVEQLVGSVKDISSFQNIFKTPKLRGNWGESALLDILSQYYPKDWFEKQHYFKSGEPVDAVLKLPDGKLLPIDSKFIFDDFRRMTEAESDADRDIARKSFIIRVKKEIDDIAQKYIIPSENTVDYAIMYIPAEAVFFEIIKSMFDEIVQYSYSKKVVLASPNTFYMVMQSVQQWSNSLQISRQTQDIIKRLSRIRQDAEQLGDSFKKLGKHLSDARSAYDDSGKRLDLFKERTDKIIELDLADVEQQPKLISDRPHEEDEV